MSEALKAEIVDLQRWRNSIDIARSAEAERMARIDEKMVEVVAALREHRQDGKRLNWLILSAICLAVINWLIKGGLNVPIP